MADTHLYLVRHAEAEAADSKDPGLSALGRAQATKLATRLSDLPLAGILHSPQRRAAETAQLLATRPGLEATESDLLRDRTPFPARDEWHQYPSHYHAWLRGTPENERDPGGHHLAEAIEHLSTSEEHLLLITHAFVIGWFVRDALDAPAWRWVGLQTDNCSLSIISYGKEKQLRAFNQH
jgi:serine/threonine-protein phosphatase PGAM5